VTGSLPNIVLVKTSGFAPLTGTATVLIDPREVYLPLIFK
jgi:hypothetical protein